MSNIQVYLLLAVSLVMGIMFGVVFGIIDVEDYYTNSLVLWKMFDKEIYICEPLGFVFGIFTGFMLEFLR